VVVVVVTIVGRLWGRGLDSFSFHGFGHFCLSLGHPSSSAFKGGACRFLVRGRRQEHEARYGKNASHPAAFIPLLNAKGVFGCWIKAVLIPLFGYPWAGFYSHSPLG
jgi:hypothetical protein